MHFLVGKSFWDCVLMHSFNNVLSSVLPSRGLTLFDPITLTRRAPLLAYFDHHRYLYWRFCGAHMCSSHNFLDPRSAYGIRVPVRDSQVGVN